MGGTGIAITGQNMNSYPNPAAVYFDQNNFTFAVYGGMSDIVWARSLPYLPGGSFGVLFVADMITIGIDLDLEATNYREETGNVDLMQTTSIQVNLSAGVGHISAGVGIQGGSVRQRLDVEMDTFADEFAQAFLAPFNRVVNSEFIKVNAGVMVNYSNLSFGVLMDNIISRDGRNTTFNISSLFDETGIGVYWTRPEYSGRGKMNNLVYSFTLEYDNIFNSRSAALKAGSEFTLRLVRDSSASVRAGYELFFRDDDVITAGVALNLKKVEMFINATFPLSANAYVEAGAVVRL